MARSRLTGHERQEIMIGLCQALCVLNTPDEIAKALTDLLTPNEVEAIAKRLQIAEMLVQGGDYREIRGKLKVGFSTIARVNTWLNLSGEGYKLMLTRRKKSPRPVKDEEKYDPYSWHNIKRRYSLYFWPQLLLEKLWESSNKQEKEKITKALGQLQVKKHTFTATNNKQLYEQFSQGNIPTNVKKPTPK